MGNPSSVRSSFGALSRVLALSLSAAVFLNPAAAFSDPANPFLSCSVSPDFANYAETLSDRELTIMKFMSAQAARLPPLEKTASHFKLAGNVVSALEFSAISLGINGLVFGAVATGAAGSVATSVSQSNLQLRQAINSTVGTAQILWAVNTPSPYGSSSSEHPLAASRPQGEIDSDLRRDDYVHAEGDLNTMIQAYSSADIGIFSQESEQHQEFNNTYGIKNYWKAFMDPQNPDWNDAGDTMQWHLLKQVNPFHNGLTIHSESLGIQITAIQGHIKLYMDELNELEKRLGDVFSTCRANLEKKNTATPEISAQAIVDSALKEGQELKIEASQSDTGKAGSAKN